MLPHCLLFMAAAACWTYTLLRLHSLLLLLCWKTSCVMLAGACCTCAWDALGLCCRTVPLVAAVAGRVCILHVLHSCCAAKHGSSAGCGELCLYSSNAAQLLPCRTMPLTALSPFRACFLSRAP